MSLTIKNQETCRLAGELARATGETMTGAITVALRERLERVGQTSGAGPREEPHAETRGQAMHKIVERLSTLPDHAPWLGAVEHGDYLYNDQGLPK